MALAVLPKVAPFCADRCLLLAGESLTRLRHAVRASGATSKPPHPRKSKNPTTTSAIQNKRQIESIHRFLNMFIPPKGQTSCPGTTPPPPKPPPPWHPTPPPSPPP